MGKKPVKHHKKTSTSGMKNKSTKKKAETLKVKDNKSGYRMFQKSTGGWEYTHRRGEMITLRNTSPRKLELERDPV